MPICSYPQQAKGMMVEAKRNSMPCHFNSSNTSFPPMQNLREKTVALINALHTDSSLFFTCAISLHLDIEAINFQGNENSYQITQHQVSY